MDTLSELSSIINSLNNTPSTVRPSIETPTMCSTTWDNNIYSTLQDSDEDDSQNSQPEVIEESKEVPGNRNPFSDPVVNDRNTVVTSNDSVKQYDYFILDSGADNHMCNNIELFCEFIPWSITSHIVLGDGTTTRECGGSGTIDW